MVTVSPEFGDEVNRYHNEANGKTQAYQAPNNPPANKKLGKRPSVLVGLIEIIIERIHVHLQGAFFCVRYLPLGEAVGTENQDVSLGEVL